MGAGLLCVGILSASTLAGCGGGSTADPCRDAPTYTRNVQPLIETACLGCHSQRLSGEARKGAPEPLNYDTFELIEPDIIAFANAFTSGAMPPADSGITVSRDERSIVSSWRRCGFLP